MVMMMVMMMMVVVMIMVMVMVMMMVFWIYSIRASQASPGTSLLPSILKNIKSRLPKPNPIVSTMSHALQPLSLDCMNAHRVCIIIRAPLPLPSRAARLQIICMPHVRLFSILTHAYI